MKLLSTSDLAKFFNISKTTVYRIVEGRKIPFYKINGALRFDEKDILEYLKENRVEPIKRR